MKLSVAMFNIVFLTHMNLTKGHYEYGFVKESNDLKMIKNKMSKRGPNLKIIVAKKKEGVHVNTKSRSQNIHKQWISFR